MLYTVCTCIKQLYAVAVFQLLPCAAYVNSHNGRGQGPLGNTRLLVCSAEELILLAQFQGSCDVDRIYFSGIWVILQQAGRQGVAVLQQLHVVRRA